MAMYIYWFLLALILLGLEMATGTFYLLMLAVAMAVGGLFAFFGFAFSIQLLTAALVGVAGIFVLFHLKGTHPENPTSQGLDIGQPVKILTLRTDGTARVFYRGAEWDAELNRASADPDAVFYIKEIRGSVLILTHHKTMEL